MEGSPQGSVPLAPPTPEKTYHYWKPSRAEWVEVAMSEDTTQGLPNLRALAHWDVYGNAGPEVAQLLGWDPLDILKDPKCQLGRNHQRLQLSPIYLHGWPGRRQ